MPAALNAGMPLQPESKKSKRRQQLWAFQREIAERTHNARDNADSGTRRLAVQAGSACLLLDLKQTGELLTPADLTPVPLTKPWFLGIANNRGNLIGVVDLAGFLGQPVAAAGKNDRLLVFASAISTHCAVRVSKVFGLIDIASMNRQSPASDSLRLKAQIYIDKEAQQWTELDLASMARDPTFLDINQ